MSDRLQIYTVTYALPGQPVSVDVVHRVVDSTVNEHGALWLQVVDEDDHPARAVSYAPGVWLHVCAEAEGQGAL